ncbi:MAG: hypothetical protein IJO50_03315 [Clostridia bacterium]|nr:hypothetical protein [Clostridia bacterium]
MMKQEHPYSDIINHRYQKSVNKGNVSVSDRAAQFSSFDALTGYGDAVSETGRLTEAEIELDEETKTALDAKLQFLLARLDEKPDISVVYFVADKHKSGGKYLQKNGFLAAFHTKKRLICLTDKTQIPIEHILEIHSTLFDRFYDE